MASRGVIADSTESLRSPSIPLMSNLQSVPLSDSVESAIEFCERALKTVCALSSAGAQRVTPIALRHANGCSPARRLLARASWRPQYPLLSKCTCRSPLATENSQVSSETTGTVRPVTSRRSHHTAELRACTRRGAHLGVLGELAMNYN
jgi:hypothetical protein